MAAPRLTCQVLKAGDGQSYCCRVDWPDAEGPLDITLTDGTRAWRAAGVQCPPEWSPREEWLQHTSDALTAVAKRAAYAYHASHRAGGVLRLQWTWPLPSGGLRKGQADLLPCDDSPAAVGALLFEAVNSFSLLRGSFASLQRLVAQQEETLGAAQRQLQELAEEKRRGEEQLFEKFARGWRARRRRWRLGGARAAGRLHQACRRGLQAPVPVPRPGARAPAQPGPSPITHHHRPCPPACPPAQWCSTRRRRTRARCRSGWPRWSRSTRSCAARSARRRTGGGGLGGMEAGAGGGWGRRWGWGW
jgi:hypothetical protein